ncbi:MAG: hypothetical protein QM811_15860 [Pirellulales bacterium]
MTAGIQMLNTNSPGGMKAPFPEQLFEGKLLPVGAARFMDDYAAFITQKPNKGSVDLAAFRSLLSAYNGKNYERFNAEVKAYKDRAMTEFGELTIESPVEGGVKKTGYAPDKVGVESQFNEFAAFHIAMPFYMIGAIAGLGALVFGRRVLLPPVFWLLWRCSCCIRSR